MSTPEDPLTQLQTGVAQQHEMFMAYVHAGFTRPEALKIIISFIVANISAANEDD